MSGKKAGERYLTDVAILTFDGMPAFEFSCALEVFGLHRPELGADEGGGYRCEALAVDGFQARSTGGVAIRVARSISAVQEFGTLVVPGWPRDRQQVPGMLARALEAFISSGGRVISICSGSFLLAELGWLDGRDATTHWAYAEEFQRRFPRVNFVADVIYTEDAPFYTSAGSSAGLDLCLHIVREDFGHEKANQVAKRLVMPAHRSGGQAQYVEKPLPATPSRLSETLDWAMQHLDSTISVDDMAEHACTSRRSFDRRFRASVGMSPKQWLIQQRLQRVCTLLESTRLDIEQVAQKSGFEQAMNLRHHFRKQFNISPTQYRQQFGQRQDRAEQAKAA